MILLVVLAATGGPRRTPGADPRHHQNLLALLEANGYALSDIEQVIVGMRDADAVYRRVCRETSRDPAATPPPRVPPLA